MTDSGKIHHGGCACGKLRYRVSGALRPVIACHCSQCRKAFTNYAAFTAAARTALTIDDAGPLAWYDSSPGVRRGFCKDCGSGLFWDNAANAFVSIAAGSLDQPSGLKLRRHIHVADKADFYEIADGLEQMPQGQGGDTWPDGRPA